MKLTSRIIDFSQLTITSEYYLGIPTEIELRNFKKVWVPKTS